jgi:nucleotidyltransferase substrate binding protein (TIGR01987 family)
MNAQLNIDALGKALSRLDESLSFDLSQPLVVDACIQRFEFCIELTWKTLKKCLAVEGIEANTPRESVQLAYSVHWINDETAWLSMLKDRNLTSHTYKEDLALEIYHRLPNHFEAMHSLYLLLNSRFSEAVE